MMKDVIIKIDQNSMVYKQETVLGISYENLQGKIIFKFLGTFPKGIAYLEYERDTEKGYLQMNQVGEEYQLEIKSSLLTKEGRIYLQLRVTEDATPEGTPVFKSNKFYLEVKEAINATTEIPDEYPEWIDTANAKIKEMDNLNITTERVEDGVDIVLTDKKGNTTRTEVKDGAPGPQGPQGEPGSVKMQVVDTLPETGETDTIYLLKKEKPGVQNLYDEYVYTNGSWEHIGDTSVDLSNYYTKDEANEELAKKQDNLTAGKNIVIENNTINAIIENEDYVILTDFPNTSAEQITFMQNAFDLALSGKTVLIVRSDNQYNYRASSDRNVYISPKIKDIDFSDKISASVSFNSPWFYRTETDIYGNNELEEYKTWLYIDCTVTKGVVTKVSFGMTSHNNTSYNRTLPVLSKTNKSSYTPTADYHPATKQYVDNQVGNINTVLATLTTVSEVTK